LPKPVVGHPPVGAVVEVLQRDLHTGQGKP
jgi:hypothetical protein